MFTRILTGLVLIAASIVVFGLLRNSLLTLGVLFVFIAIGGAEFLAMRWSEKGGSELRTPKLRLGHWLFGLSYAVPLLFVSCPQETCGHVVLLGTLAAWCSVLLLVNAAFVYRAFGDLEKASGAWVSYLAGFVYLTLPGLVLLELTRPNFGATIYAAPFWFVVAVVYMGDTGAYFTGVTIGKHKLIPGVSPKKTWEGSLGGLVWSGGTALLLNWLWQFQIPWTAALSAGIILGVSGQIGDLIESAIKRVAGYKDSGWIFPGHGGVLDRIDSLLFAAPVCYGIFLAFGLV